MRRRSKVEEITDVLTEEGIKKLSVGQVLMFRYEGSRNDLKITKIKDGRVWARHIITRDPSDVIVTDKEGNSETLTSLAATPAPDLSQG